MRKFNDILENAKQCEKKNLVVPQPRSKRVFTAINEAKKAGFITPVLVDTEDISRENLSSLGIDHTGYEFVEIENPSSALAEAMQILHRNEADMIFQGDLNGKYFLDTIAENDGGIVQMNALSYVSLFELPTENKMILLTDTFIQEFPDLKQKIRILTNALSLTDILGIEKPNVAALTMLERVNIAVPSTTDAAVLAKMSERGQFNATVDGPLDIDCASSPEKAQRKGIKSPVSGKVDIYLLPDIESGYCIAEVMTYLGRAPSAGILLGSDIPIILNLKFEPTESLVLNIALALLRTP